MKRALNYAAVLLLMLLGVCPQLALICESFGCGVGRYFWLWFLAVALCLWFSACFEWGLLLGMPAAAGLLYAAYRYFHGEPLNELRDLADRIAGAYYTQYYASGAQYRYLDLTEDHSFLLLLLGFLLTAYLASALTTRSGRRGMGLLGTLPFFAGCLAVNGTPDYAPVVAMLLFWALLLASGGSYQPEGPCGQIVFLSGMPMLLLLSGLLYFSRPQDYRFDEQDIELSRQFDRIGDLISRWIDQSVSGAPLAIPGTVYTSPEPVRPEDDVLLWEATDGGMDMTQSYAAEMLEKVFFRVRSERSGSLYLRALSYGDYLGTGWESAGEAPVSSLAFTAQAVSDAAERRSLTVQRTGTLRFACLPYYSPLVGTSDAWIAADAAGGRLGYYQFAGSFESLSLEREEELLYRGFAHEVYTRLPEQTRSAVLALASEAGLRADSPALIDQVADYVRAAGVYDLETAPYPSGDYALWFLTQAHRGYCVHFASAATVLYRALGVPARITEGFLIHTEPGQTVDVRGANAHAWVEVYLDGIGWVPVEVTGRSGLQPEAVETQQPEETDEPVDETTAPQAVPTETDAPADELPVGVITRESEAPSENSYSPAADMRGPDLRLLLSLLLLIAALPLWYLLRRALWRRSMEQRDPNRAAVAIWRCAKRVEGFGGTMPDEIRSCAEKAVFSASGVSEEELRVCRERLTQMTNERDAALKPLRRMAFRYLHGLK